MANLTSLTSLSLLSWWRLSCPIVGLKIISLPTFALKSPNFHMVLKEMIKKPALIPHKSYLLTPHFFPRLLYAHLQQIYYASDLSALYMTTCR